MQGTMIQGVRNLNLKILHKSNQTVKLEKRWTVLWNQTAFCSISLDGLCWSMSDILPVIRSVVRFIQVISSLPVQYLASYVTDRYLTDVDEVYNL